MHNWRFLLLAFVAVFQPIASYTERGLVDGRQQRCDYRRASVLQDPGVHFHGTYRFSKPAVEDRRLNQRADVRETRQNEVREESRRTTSSPDRRLIENLERGDHTPTRLGSFSRIDTRLARNGVVLRQETRDTQIRDYRVERNQEIRGDNPLSHYGSRRTRLDSWQPNSRLSEDENRSQFRVDNRRSIPSRVSMEIRRDRRGHRENAQTQQGQQTRKTLIVSDRAMDDITRSRRVDRRIARERLQTLDLQRSESLQFNSNANHGILEQRLRNTELRSSSMPSTRVHRVHNNKESRMATRADTRSLDRNERRSTEVQRSVDEQTQQRDIHRSKVTITKNSVSARQRDIPQAFNRNGKETNLQTDRTTESRRDLSQARSLGRDRSVENLRENGRVVRDTKGTEAIRFVENRVSQILRRDSRILERERSVDNRRDVRDNFQSVQRIAENRRDSRSAERARVLDNRREIRNIAKESRVLSMDRTGKNKREAEFEHIIEARRETQKNNRDSCLLNSERSAGRRVINRNIEVVARMTTDRSAENQRNTRNVVRDSRILRLERGADNRRDTRSVERESRVLERTRIADSLRNTRLNLRDVRSFEEGQSLAIRRDSRNIESRTFRVNDNDRRDARNLERQTRSVERTANYRRDSQEHDRDVRTNGLKQHSEIRDSRNTQKDSRARAPSFEGRRDLRNVERQSRTTGEIRVERDVPAVRPFRGERLSERRMDVRKFVRNILGSERLAENKRERTTEIRRDIRNIETDARTVRTEEAKRDSRVINMARSGDSRLMERKNYRTERLNMPEAQLDDRRSRSVQREFGAEIRRTFERNNVEMERREVESAIRKQQFLGMNRNPTQEENEAPPMNWQYIFYTLQGLYICGVLTQLMNERSAVKKTRSLSWWSAPQHLIKVD